MVMFDVDEQWPNKAVYDGLKKNKLKLSNKETTLGSAVSANLDKNVLMCWKAFSLKANDEDLL